MILTSPSRCRSTSPVADESSTVVIDFDPALGVTVSPTTTTADPADCVIQGLTPLQMQALASEMIVLMNEERSRQGLEPLAVSKSLETFARMEADAMADTGDIKPWFQSIQELEELLHSSCVGENIGRAKSIEELQEHIMADEKRRCRLLSEDFTEVGVALAQGSDDNLYLCQLFRKQDVDTVSEDQ